MKMLAARSDRKRDNYTLRNVAMAFAMSACLAAVSLGQSLMPRDTARWAAAEGALSAAMSMRGHNDATVMHNLAIADSLFKLLGNQGGRRRLLHSVAGRLRRDRFHRHENCCPTARPA